MTTSDSRPPKLTTQQQQQQHIATANAQFAMHALRRTMATMAAQSPLKQAGKVVCIGRNYACAGPDPYSKHTEQHR
jgi:2-keto-4-pentenoate hydratase/2-oxohepta-3-ene-1,7-dioic acid hydratase in catechol pathway